MACELGGGGNISFNFGDQSSDNNAGTQVGSAVDAGGLPYRIQEYKFQHTYASAAQYTASFNTCCRLSDLKNGADDSFRIEAKLDLDPSNTSGVNTAVNALLQMQVGGVRSHVFPAFDADGDPISCRFATPSESQLPVGEDVPTIVGTTSQPTLQLVPGGCKLTWDVTNGAVPDRYAVAVVLESVHNGVISSAPIDVIIEMVPLPLPQCTINGYVGGSGSFSGGEGQFSALAGEHVTIHVTGNDATVYPNDDLTMTVTNEPASAMFTPVDPTTGPKPFATTIDWVPTVADAGISKVVLVNYTNSANITGSCALNLFAPLCSSFGDACSAGVGACYQEGVTVCFGSNSVCNAVAGQPSLEICGSPVDEDCDGVHNNQCPDSDGDGVVDQVEIDLGSDPNDADSDDDGVLDGQEPGTCVDYAGCVEDADGDGLVNILDPDSDNDGLKDGTEMGFGCDHPDTDVSAGNCIPDGDQGATTTDPLNPDTDGGGTTDGSEDPNLNGVIDPGEGSPSDTSDDLTNGPTPDSDNDGIGDALEVTLGTDPLDADSDDDGLLDGLEINPAADTDGDGLINVLDADSDGDLLFDGLEMGKNCSDPATDPTALSCAVDADQGLTTTSPVLADSDNGGVSDGAEDLNLNGMINDGEFDPKNPADDINVTVSATENDSDGDGLSDATEIALGSDPLDQDADDDGLLDSDEVNPAADTDGDGLANIVDFDSDNDGLPDGLEAGRHCGHPDTDVTLGQCLPDQDLGATTTMVLVADSDGGGVLDGIEDVNKDGVVEVCETDPNNAGDDVGAGCEDNNPCTVDICGANGCEYPSKLDGTPCEGGVCIASECVLDSAVFTTSSNASSSSAGGAGSTSGATTTVGSGGATGASNGELFGEGALEGSGFNCAVAGANGDGHSDTPAWLMLGLAALLWRRRGRNDNDSLAA